MSTTARPWRPRVDLETRLVDIVADDEPENQRPTLVASGLFTDDATYILAAVAAQDELSLAAAEILKLLQQKQFPPLASEGRLAKALAGRKAVRP